MKAFPEVNYVKPGGEIGVSIMAISGGMDLRDYFAAKALQGLLNEAHDDFSNKAITELSYSLADAMMEARK